MRIFKRVLLTLLLLVVALIGFVVLSVPADAWRTRDSIANYANTDIPGTGGPAVNAWVARPASDGSASAAPLPAVIMIHEFWGMRDEIVGKAEALAQEGFVVVAPDTYRGQTTHWLPRAIWLTLTTPDAQVHTDLDAVFKWLAQQPDVDPGNIVVMGFCYGGGKALSYSLTNPELAGTGIFYGTLIADAQQLARLPAPVLGIFGEEDTRPSPDDARAFEAALEEAGIPNVITIYPGVGHAFVTSAEAIRTDPTQAAAWEQFVTWLRAVTT